MPISGDTLIRDIRRAPEADVVTPSVLGIDDWAQRRGQTYGTILVDLESSRPIDLLNSREAQAVITWLEEHHGVKIISRDRSNEYIYAATTAAPQAEQVADRWHLLKNLRESLETMLLHKPTVLRAAAGATGAIESAGMEEISPNLQEAQAKQEHALAPPEWTKAAQNKAARQQRRQARYERVRQLHEAGHTTRDIARQTGLARRTVQKYIAAETCPQYPEGRLRASKMHPWMPYMEQRWQEGCTNASQLWREINAQGFSGSRSLVSRWAAKERSLLSKPRRYRRQQPKHVTPALSRQENPRPWSPQRASWLLVKDRDQLDDNERNVLARMMATDEQVAIASRLSERFVRMVKQQEADELHQWLKDTTASGVRALVSLANGIRQDFAAVKNALRLPWSNGPVEGHINRLKFIKRMMFGRANFDLLRKRVLYRCPGSAP